MDNNKVGNRRVDKLHIYICLLAAAVVTAVCLYRRESLYQMAIWASIAIAVFYVIGHIIRYYLVNTVFLVKEEEEEPPEEGFEDIADDAAREMAQADDDIVNET